MGNELVSVFDDFFGKNNRLVGFNNLFEELSTDFKSTNFPPYSIYQDVDENNKHTYIDVATAGFKKNELKVSFDERRHCVEVSGEKMNKNIFKYDWKGIANRNFSIKWKMNPSLEFEKCSYEDGILHIEFKEKPREESEVKMIEIQ